MTGAAADLFTVNQLAEELGLIDAMAAATLSRFGLSSR